MSLEELAPGGLGPARITEEELINSAADFFAPPLLDDSVVLSRECTYHPMQSLNQQGQLTFVIPGEAGLFIDPSTFRLVGKIRVLQLDTTTNKLKAMGDADTDKNKVSISNLIGTTLFQGITCTMNGTNVSFVETTHVHYKSYLQNICTYGSDAAATHLVASGFKMDTAGSFDTLTAGGNADRAGWVNKSAVIGFSSWVHCDLLETNHYLPDNMGMTLNFTRNKDYWLLLTAATDKDKYHIVIDELEIRVKKVQLVARIANDIERRLNAGQRLRYPIVRSQIKILNVAKGSPHFNWPNAIFGQLPFMVCCGMVEQTAYAGDVTKNGVNFQNFTVNDFWYVKNNYDLPAQHYRPDWGSRGYLREYRQMNDYLHGGRANAGDQITPALFKEGCTLFPMDLTPDSCAGFHRHNIGSGTLSVNANFTTALPNAITVILYACYYDEYQIDGDRIVYAVTTDKATPIG